MLNGQLEGHSLCVLLYMVSTGHENNSVITWEMKKKKKTSINTLKCPHWNQSKTKRRE